MSPIRALKGARGKQKERERCDDRSQVRDATFLALKMKGDGHESRNEGSP